MIVQWAWVVPCMQDSSFQLLALQQKRSLKEINLKVMENKDIQSNQFDGISEICLHFAKYKRRMQI